ncbi:hypothetical protein IV203_011517 [Nitzschia inconspicua]|uniref:Uncharacterized protein n=1 Tax=Nitzschia inconspicua TaxID=303405 RepID=A0A9K3KS89_9STRA|nr:hypothetical protein IV203_011517 [Nitzschia inconspicua]
MTISDVNRNGSVDGSEATAAASKTTSVSDEEVKSSVVFVGCNDDDDDDDCSASALREQDCSQQERHQRDETAAERESPIHMVVTTNSSEEEELETDTTALSTVQAPSQTVQTDRSFQRNQQHPTRPRLRTQRRRSINTNTSYSRLSVASGRRHRLHPGQRHTQNSWITSLMFLIPVVVFFVRKIFFSDGHQMLILPLFFTLIAIGGVGVVATLLICLQDRLEEWITKPPKHTQQNQPPSLPPLVNSATTIHDSSDRPNKEDQSKTETKDHRHTKIITNTTRRQPPQSQDVVSPSFALSSKPFFHVSPSLQQQKSHHHHNHQNNGSDHDTTTTTTSAKSIQLQPIPEKSFQRPTLHRRRSSSSLLPPRTSSPCLNSITEGQMEDEFDIWWRELDSQTKYFALLLGYTQKTWDEDYELEDLECENFYWDELTPEQQAAAIYFGCDPNEWDSE